MATYAVQGLRCPIIVRTGCETHRYEDGRPGIWHDIENRCEESFAGNAGECSEEMGRCDTPVQVLLAISQSGKGYGDVCCVEGHDLKSMAHDNALDLDGVPVNA